MAYKLVTSQGSLIRIPKPPRSGYCVELDIYWPDDAATGLLFSSLGTDSGNRFWFRVESDGKIHFQLFEGGTIRANGDFNNPTITKGRRKICVYIHFTTGVYIKSSVDGVFSDSVAAHPTYGVYDAQYEAYGDYFGLLSAQYSNGIYGTNAGFELYSATISAWNANGDHETVGNTKLRYNPGASGGTGSVLPEKILGQDGELVNFPTDDSQWIEYATFDPSQFYSVNGTPAPVVIPDSYIPPSPTNGQTLVITEKVLENMSQTEQDAFWGNVESTGGDIRLATFTDGTKQLPVDLVSIDTTARKLVLHTRRYSYDGLGTTYLYFGKAGETQPPVTDPFGRNAVWVDRFRQWNMNEQPNALIDSTGNSGNYTNYDVADISSSTGLNGKALSFGETGGYIEVGNTTELESTPISLSTIVNVSDVTTPFAQTIFASRSDDNDTNIQAIIYPESFNASRRSSTQAYPAVDPNTTPLNQWVHVHFVAESTSNKLYVNGQLVASSSFSPFSVEQSNMITQIGAMRTGTTNIRANQFSYGKIDSIGLLKSALSPEYIATEYANQNDPATFFGTPTLSTTGGGLVDHTITLDSGSYSLQGDTLALLSDRNLSIENGSYVLTGQELNLVIQRSITLLQGSYSLQGSNSLLLKEHILTLDSSSYTYSADNISLLANRKITTDSGDYSYSGSPINFIYEVGGITYTLSLDSGNYSLTGESLGLLTSRRLPIDFGTYTYEGVNSNLLYNKVVALDSGVYSSAGTDLGIRVNRRLVFDNGNYSLQGTPVTLSYTGEVLAILEGYSLSYKKHSAHPEYKKHPVHSKYKTHNITARYN